ncbi:serine/threonine protein kinase [Spirulina sp. 06S082]|uniref:serine/threonine protein kinase n=1 Tax=Spirulina sp. 06S082 TaxID=3110248 RepID=UPI002B215159|nr:protein kinase [Spirulina sp. 06S082]MEA5467498.1 protein kinase [Spirulina sp. 06S082]
MTTATATENDFKYSLEDSIGQGIFSTTYPATEVNSNKPVIIKTLAASLHDHPHFDRFCGHFLDLSQHLARVSHPHLPGIWESFAEEGVPYVVCDRILGQNLADKIASEGAVSESRAKRWIEQIAAAVSTLHAANLQHLDIQPRNIIYRPQTDDVVLVDLGMACNLTPEIRQTHANLIAPGYAAIEQYDPKGKTSTATDIYALSAVFYFLLAGNPLPPVPLLEHIPPEKWQKFPESISLEIKQAILQGLATPNKRPQTLEAWLALWHPAPIPEPAEAIVPKSPPAETQPQTKSKLPAETPPEKRSPVELPSVPATPQNSSPAILEELEPSGNSTPQQKPEKREKTDRKTSVVAGKTPRKGKKPSKKPPKAAKSTKAKPGAKLRFPVGALLMTSAIAASAGAGFGLSLRLNRPTEAGSTFWHNEQSFPPRDDFPSEGLGNEEG